MEKARKLAGGEAKKKVKFIEDHHDDSGSDLSGLGRLDVIMLAQDYPFTSVPGSDWPSSDDDEPCVHNLSTWWLLGSEHDGAHPSHSTHTHIVIMYSILYKYWPR